VVIDTEQEKVPKVPSTEVSKQELQAHTLQPFVIDKYLKLS
jgi:hypothetical protein